MIFGFGWATWLTWLLAAFFLADGVMSAIGPEPMRLAFANWGFPSWWHLVNAVVCLLVGIMLLFPATRPLGFLLGAAECFAIFAVMIHHREFAHMAPAAVLLLLLTLAYWGSYGWRLPESVAA